METLQYYDIMKEGVTKASAITILAQHLGIKKEEIIAIGDGGNDIEMLQTAGLKVAMKNASNSLKEIADFVTSEDNNAGGVGIFLYELFKQLQDREMRQKEAKKIEDEEQSL